VIDEQVRRRLPGYMVPSAIVLLHSLPLSPNGKLDRSALPPPEADLRVDGDHVPPATPTERLLAGLWEELIGARPVGRTDDFFELGGHSLLATRLVARVRTELGVAVPLDTLFEEPVLYRYAAALDRSATAVPGPDDTPPVTRVDRSARRLRPGALAADPAALCAAAAGRTTQPDGELVVFPASHAQERMWVLEQLEPGRALYNVPVARRIVGPVDVPTLEAAFARLVAHHEVLRTSLTERDGAVLQVVHPEVTIRCEVLDPGTDGDPWAAALDCSIAGALQPFDLTIAPLARVALVRAGTEEDGHADGLDRWVFCLTAHHSIVDGASVELLMDQLRRYYEAPTGPDPHAPDENPAPDYGDCVVWQDGPALARRVEDDLDFWRHHLRGAPRALEFPFDHPRPPAQSHRGGRAFHRVGPEAADGIRRLATDSSATLFMTVLAGWGALLARYARQEDVVIGVPVSGRSRPEMDNVVGLFVNTLPLRISVHDDPSLAELVARARTSVLEGMRHQHAPFERIVDQVAQGRDLARHPVFQVLATVQPDRPTTERFGGAELSSVPVDWGWSRFTDLSLVVMEHDGELRLGLEYSSDLLDADTAERLCRNLEGLLAAGAAEPDVPVSDLDIAGAEQALTLEAWNDTARPYPSGRRIHDLLSDQAAASPDAVALECGDERLTYGELDARANRLAHRLVELGTGPDSIVAICIDRSIEMVVAMLGILKAGGAYLPVDTAYPQDRIEFILADAATTLLLTTVHLLPRIGRHEGDVLCVDAEAEALEAYPSTPPSTRTTSRHLAYVIYTSGSTGYPKGTLIEHEGVVNLAADVIETFALDEQSRVLQFASFTFDASILDLVIPLCAGSTVCLAPQEVLASVPDLIRLLVERRITTVTLPPSLLAVLPDTDLPDLVTLCAAGEACHPEIVRRWGTGRRFINGYGPTEATVLTTTFTVESSGGDGRETLPLGRPLPNVQLYVLDDRMRPVPIGCPGELYIGGVGLARGYLGRPELTAERFVPHPFTDEPGARVYRTGDCVRWLADGKLEYRGRLDFQVKFRGYRIELGEIEQALLRHPDVLSAVVVVRTNDKVDGAADERLVAYLQCAEGTTLGHAALRTFVRESLPDYMVPNAFVLLDALPVTPNGKLDRDALPAPSDRRPADTDITAPRGPLEELVAGIWCDVLGLERIGAHDDVYELGANSLDAARVASQLRGHSLDVSLRALFDHATVASVARYLFEGLSAESGDAVDDLLATDGTEAP